MRVSCALLALLCLLHSLAAAPALPRSSPESQGVSSDAILAFVTEAEKSIDALHSMMILRRGQVIAEGWWAPYAASKPHELYSLSKSFTSTAVGLAIAEGKLSLDDEVLKFFPDQAPAEPSANLKAMRVRDLLRMSTGHDQEPPRSGDGMSTEGFLSHPVPFKPGTRFLYNTPATFMLSAMVQKATGQTVLEYLKPRLFEPLGIENPTWGTNHQGLTLGGYGLNLRTEDIARFGQLYLQRGQWNGRQVLPAAWVDQATSRQTSNGSHPKSDWDQGYGFQFWRSRHDTYRGDGAFGQYCLVLPDQEVVIAITSGVKDMQAVMNLVWDRLLPAFQDGSLPANAAAETRLRERLRGLRLPFPAGESTAPAAASRIGGAWVFPTNDLKLESLTLEGQSGTVANVRLRFDGRDQVVPLGQGEWRSGTLAWGTFPEAVVDSAGAWATPDQFVAKIVYSETPYILTLKLGFQESQVTVEPEFNVGFGSTRPTPIVGRQTPK